MSQPLLNRRYKIIEQLGSGGTALVFRAQDLSLSRIVAVKVLRESLTTDAEFLNRFQDEARAAANLAHPNIITIHDFGVDGRYYYIVMEHLEGTDLKELIRQKSPFTVDRFLNYAIQMCAGIGYAHRAGLVHCDVKPQNMLVTPEGRVKVTDFGIARALVSIQPSESHAVVWGSPQYFSPEQAAGEAPTPSSDVYSLGVLLYQLLTGQLPYALKRPTAAALEEAILEAQLHKPSMAAADKSVRRALQGDLDIIVLKAMALAPGRRYGSAEAFAQDIERHLESQPILARPASRGYVFGRWARRHAWALSAGTALVAGVLFLLVTTLFCDLLSPPEPPHS